MHDYIANSEICNLTYPNVIHLPLTLNWNHHKNLRKSIHATQTPNLQILRDRKHKGCDQRIITVQSSRKLKIQQEQKANWERHERILGGGGGGIFYNQNPTESQTNHSISFSPESNSTQLLQHRRHKQ